MPELLQLQRVERRRLLESARKELDDGFLAEAIDDVLRCVGLLSDAEEVVSPSAQPDLRDLSHEWAPIIRARETVEEAVDDIRLLLERVQTASVIEGERREEAAHDVGVNAARAAVADYAGPGSPWHADLMRRIDSTKIDVSAPARPEAVHSFAGVDPSSAEAHLRSVLWDILGGMGAESVESAAQRVARDARLQANLHEAAEAGRKIQEARAEKAETALRTLTGVNPESLEHARRAFELIAQHVQTGLDAVARIAAQKVDSLP